MLRRVISLGVALIAVFAVTANAQDRNQVDRIRYMQGRIVRFDPVQNNIVVRIGERPEARETQYAVDANTRYWGSDRQALSDGLRNKAFKEGMDVWFRTGAGTGTEARTMSDVRLYDPANNLIPNENPNRNQNPNPNVEPIPPSPFPAPNPTPPIR